MHPAFSVIFLTTLIGAGVLMLVHALVIHPLVKRHWLIQGLVLGAVTSLVVGLEPGESDGLPAVAPGEDSLFEGRAVVRLPTRSGRPRR